MKDNKKPSRQSLPLAALERLYVIDQQIASGKYPNTNVLVESLKIASDRLECKPASIATVSRDIAFMRDRLYAPIEYDHLKNGYYYTEKTFRLPGVFTSADDLLALSMAKNILSIYRNTPIYDAAHHLLENITMPLSAEGNADWYESRIVVPQVPTASVLPDIWNIITSALKENRVVTFDYLGVYDDNYKSRRVRPYQLLFDTGVWYLYGFAEERKGIRMFSLSRIKNLRLTKDRFILPENFDYRASNSGSYFGVFAGQKKYRFKIAVYNYSVPWVKDRQWADDQKIKDDDDGIIISFTSTQFDKVMQWVLSCGCNARPLEPELLVNYWYNEIAEMQKMTGKK